MILICQSAIRVQWRNFDRQLYVRYYVIMLTKNSVNLPQLPRIASMREVQRNYRQLFDWVEKTKKPLILTNNARIKVVVLEPSYYNELSDRANQKTRDTLVPFYKNEPTKKELERAVEGIKQLAKQGRQDVNLTDFVIKDRENH